MQLKIIGYREALELAYNGTMLNSTKPYMLISIQDYDSESMGLKFKRGGKCKKALNIHFSDIDPKELNHNDFKVCKHELRIMTDSDVHRILEFVERAEQLKVDNLVIQCHAGVSRSSAVAAAITLILGGDDRDYFRSKIYLPNMYVYSMLVKNCKKYTKEEAANIINERIRIRKNYDKRVKYDN